MNPNFLSHLHTHLREARLTRRNATHLPEDVPAGIHKEYLRMPSIELPEPKLDEISLAEVLRKRSSAFAGHPDTSISLQELGTLLGLALGKRPGSFSRNYPSGGALYPVETYLISNAIESQVPGVFHYNPTINSLETLRELAANFEMKALARYPEDLPLSCLLVFTGVWHRSSAKYGDLSYLHTLLEAGHMSENLLLVGTGLGLQMRPYAGFNDDMILELLDLNPEDEQPVHSITICKS